MKRPVVGVAMGPPAVAVAPPAYPEPRADDENRQSADGLVTPANRGGAVAMGSIADYALLADCHAAALVGRDGSVDWCCMPRYDTGSMFGALLDPEAGACTVEVEGGGVEGRGYLDGTLVL